MQRIVFIVILLLCGFNQGRAQTFFSGTEYGIAAGGSQYFGDLNDNYGFKFIRPAGGLFTRFHLNPFIAIRITGNYTKIGYDDKLSDNPYNVKRNLNFRSDIYEFAIQSEFNFFRFSTGEENGRFTPYLTGGIGGFYFNPYTKYNGQTYYLRGLGTEGQTIGYDDRKRYSNFSLCFPVGAGIKYWLRPGFNLGFEIADRLTVTDYMDDVSKTYIGSSRFPTDPQNPNPAYVLQDRSIEVSNEPLGREGKQRGNSSTKDQYLMFMINLSFQLKVYKCPTYLKGAERF